MRKTLGFLILIAALLLGSQNRGRAGELTLAQAVTWLENESHQLIRSSRRTMKDGTAAFPPQVGTGYEAFWLRDFAYTLEGSIDACSEKELRDACRVFVQNIRADGAGVDCVRFDGCPVYRPGYGTMGMNPVADGGPFTVAVAWHTYRKTKDAAFLAGMIDALVKTLRATPRNPENGLVHIAVEGWDRCPYGFTDTVRMQGDVLFCSLLYVQASQRLAGLLEVLQRNEESGHWKLQADTVAESIRHILWDPDVGLFRAATVHCREHHIWGSAFAVYLGVADETQAGAIAAYFQANYRSIVDRGQIRHLPGGVYWEECSAARDTYQNGAYWATPTGWFVYTLDLADSGLADRTVTDLVACFRKHGACEWISGDRYTLPGYLASASLPLAGIRAMIDRRQAKGTTGRQNTSAN